MCQQSLRSSEYTLWYSQDNSELRHGRSIDAKLCLQFSGVKGEQVGEDGYARGSCAWLVIV